MKLTQKLLGCLLVLVSLTCCKSKHFTKKESATLNSSALYSPTSVTSLEGHQYQFAEGVWIGTGEKVFSQAAFTRALTIGKEK